MIVNIAMLTSAVQKVKSFADGNPNASGVMFDIAGDKLNVCFSDGHKSIIEKLDIVAQEGDEQGQVIVAYNRLMSIIEMCQPSGEIIVGDITITFSEGKTMLLDATKYMVVRKSAESKGLDGEDVYTEASKPVSKFSQKMTYERPEESKKYGAITRMDFDSVFVDEANNGEEDANFDTWSVAELRKVLSKTSVEKGKTIYVSSKEQAAFVLNMAYVTYIPTDGCTDHGMTISTSLAKSLVEILGKLKDDAVRICVKEKRYCNIINGIDTVGIWFELAPASKAEMGALGLYKNNEYDTFNLVFSLAALKDAIGCAMSSSKDEKTIWQFCESEGQKSLRISIENSSASISSDFDVMLERANEIENWDTLKETKIPVSLKVISDMVNDCESTYVAVDMQFNENGNKFIRIADVSKDENKKKVLGATHYTLAAK